MKRLLATLLILLALIHGAGAEEQLTFSFDGEWYSGSFITNKRSFQTFVRQDGDQWVSDSASILCTVDADSNLLLGVTKEGRTTRIVAALSQLSDDVYFVYWVENEAPTAYYIETSNDNYADGVIVCYEVIFDGELLFSDGVIYSNDKTFPKSENMKYMYQDGIMHFIEDDSYFDCEVIFASDDAVVLPTGNIVSHTLGIPCELVNVFIRTSADK